MNKRQESREIVCNVAFEMLHFLRGLTFEDLAASLKNDETITGKNIRIMRNNLVNYLRLDKRFSLSDAESGEDVAVKLSAYGKAIVAKQTKKEKVTRIRKFIKTQVAI